MSEDMALLEASGDIAFTYINGFRDTRIIIQEAINAISELTEDSDMNIFYLVAIQNYSYRQACQTLGMGKRAVEYRYKKVISSILDFLKNEKGIKSFEELLHD
ncbi:MAG: hypothetical protein GY754_17505 [bacterium]|nr:hypothetical protein [bacterium]